VALMLPWLTHRRIIMTTNISYSQHFLGCSWGRASVRPAPRTFSGRINARAWSNSRVRGMMRSFRITNIFRE
jgi:hypothetical protein